MAAHDYDVLVAGAGQGGLPAAHMAANFGAKVALIARHSRTRRLSEGYDSYTTP